MSQRKKVVEKVKAFSSLAEHDAAAAKEGDVTVLTFNDTFIPDCYMVDCYADDLDLKVVDSPRGSLWNSNGFNPTSSYYIPNECQFFLEECGVTEFQFSGFMLGDEGTNGHRYPCFNHTFYLEAPCH